MSMTSKRNSQLTITLLCIAAVVLALAASSCGSADVKPRGKVIPYKLAKKEQFGEGTEKVINLYLVSYTADVEQLQFVAQEAIIKENKKDSKVHGITVGFYQNGPIRRRTEPTASMNWVRKDPTWLDKVGFASKDPFSSGQWEWIVSDPDGLDPSIVTDSVSFDKSSKKVTVKGHTAKKAGSITALVLNPALTTISRPIKGKLLNKDNDFQLEWTPPTGLKPVPGDYVIRIIAAGANKVPTSELLIKIDMRKLNWNPPAGVVLY